ncbi:MAG: hypothetical protein JW882_04085 [Deltaproteobacteria bacterium]|nr:hypothetical protein [Deltaproteobacteria bacterium]
MGPILDVNIYGLRTRIECLCEEDRRDISRLLKFFLEDGIAPAVRPLSFRKKAVPQEIGSLLFPRLARKGIWVMHSGGFHFNGGFLTVGPSDCGKSTFSHMAMKHGCPLLSDDVTLMKEKAEDIELLPFYSALYLKHEVIVPDQALFKTAELKCLLLPRFNNGPVRVKKIEKKIEKLRRIAPQFLWSYCSAEQKRQKRFVEKMCNYPAYEVYWNSDMFTDAAPFRVILDEIIQSAG